MPRLKTWPEARTRRIRQQPDRERVLERFLDFLQRQRAIEIEGRIIPIKLHIGWIVIVISTPMQCLYIVFTGALKACQQIFPSF